MEDSAYKKKIKCIDKETVSRDLTEQHRQWAREIYEFHIVRWEELPELELYMDQTIAFLRKKMALFEEEGNSLITPAMINNYVKLGLIPKPCKKKYTRRHLAFLITIIILKQVLTISEIREGILFYIEEKGTGAASYNWFCEEQEMALRLVCGQLLYKGEGNSKNGEKSENSVLSPMFPQDTPTELVMLRMAAFSFACRLTARKSLQLRKKEEKSRRISL